MYNCASFHVATAANRPDESHVESESPTHLVGLCKLAGRKHGGKGNVIHAHVAGQDGGNFGISNRFGRGGFGRRDATISHGRCFS